MNFNIVEGDTLMQHKEEFIILYNDPTIPVNSIPELLGISHNNMARLRKECQEEGRINLRYNKSKKRWEKKNKPRYYQVYRRGEIIKWQIKRKGVYYGMVYNVKQAQEFVKKLKECNWNKNLAKKIREEIIKEY